MRAILEERNFPIEEIRFFASARSAGTTLPWKGTEITVEDAHKAGLEAELGDRMPRGPRAAKAAKTAVHAGDILAAAKVVPDLEAAVADCRVVFAATAKPRRR